MHLRGKEGIEPKSEAFSRHGLGYVLAPAFWVLNVVGIVGPIPRFLAIVSVIGTKQHS